MEKNTVYERDLLYPTDSINDPGCIHVEVLNPNKSGKMPIVIESKTNHSPIKYINAIIRIMQIDIFDRIHIEVKDSADLFIKTSQDMKKDYGDKPYIKVVFDGEKAQYMGIEEI